MKLISYLLSALFFCFVEYGFAQQSPISEKPTMADFMAGDSTSNYILGDEGVYTIKLMMTHYHFYYNEDDNDFFWEVRFERKARMRVLKSINELPLFSINENKEDLSFKKVTLFILEKGVPSGKNLSNKNWVTTIEDDRKNFSIKLDGLELPVIIDYTYAYTFKLDKMAPNETNLTFALNNIRFPTAYANIKFIIPEHFTSEITFQGINKITPKKTIQSNSITIANMSSFPARSDDVVYGYSQQVDSFLIENIKNESSPISITSVVKQFKKVIVQ